MVFIVKVYDYIDYTIVCEIKFIRRTNYTCITAGIYSTKYLFNMNFTMLEVAIELLYFLGTMSLIDRCYNRPILHTGIRIYVVQCTDYVPVRLK